MKAFGLLVLDIGLLFITIGTFLDLRPGGMIHYVLAGSMSDETAVFAIGSCLALFGLIILGLINLTEQKDYEETHDKPKWFYEFNSKAIGPVGQPFLLEWIKEETISADQLVRREDESDWSRLADRAELKVQEVPKADIQGY